MSKEIKFEFGFTNHAPVVFTITELMCGNFMNLISKDVGSVKYKRQFTGLTDKKGMDIYEGDLLDFGNKNPVEVIFKNGAFTVFDEPLGWDFDSCEYPVETDFQYCEVIGNRYQKPELLNK